MVFVFYDWLITDGWNDLAAWWNKYWGMVNNFLDYLKTLGGMVYAFWFVQINNVISYGFIFSF